jgi:lipopolysaccharide transport system ATP-binding protein
MKPAIRIEGLSKEYRIGAHRGEDYQTLRESIMEAVKGGLRCLTRRGRKPAGEADERSFWALKDVSFEVAPGEMVGIIGRNGAGKSTLLKCLSRITEPSEGRCEVRGRIGSLLEVGTGFHSELTGRENVYLNGSILGMTRREISRKFDEIVAFSDIGKFIDTPVKRYSSGMYVRLAFAVAAHLDLEVLVVDEVLAVGDLVFQQRCFQKMEQLRKTGRTLLVVSHNTGALLSVCTKAVTLDHGQLVSQGSVEQEVTGYLGRLADLSKRSLQERQDREGDGQVRVSNFVFLNRRGEVTEQAISGEELNVALTCEAADLDVPVQYVSLSCWAADGVKLFHVDNVQRGQPLPQTGRTRRYGCRFPRLPLPPGMYHWNVTLSGGGSVYDQVSSAGTLEVLGGDFYGVDRPAYGEGGRVLMDHDWSEM